MVVCKFIKVSMDGWMIWQCGGVDKESIFQSPHELQGDDTGVLRLVINVTLSYSRL